MFRFSSTLLVVAAFVVATHSAAEEKGKPRPKTVTGSISKVDAASLAVTQRGDSGEKTSTFTLNDQTKVLVQTEEDDKLKGEGGRERLVPKTREGKVGDLKLQQRVTITYAEEGKADSILVLRALKARKEGEK